MTQSKISAIEVRVDLSRLDWKPQIGETVRITDPKVSYYGQLGKIESMGSSGGWYVRHGDGQLVYHPWGIRPTNRGLNDKI